jgi:hypothetical protein
MATLCRCERCSRVVERRKGSILRKLTFVALFATTLPYAWLLFVAGPGLLGVLPIVVGIGLSIEPVFGKWAFPRPLCEHCGASLEHAPAIDRKESSLTRAERSPAAP